MNRQQRRAQKNLARKEKAKANRGQNQYSPLKNGGGAPSLDAALRQAAEFGQRGRLKEAKEAYNLILSKAPNHPEALHFMGLCLLQMGETTDALGSLEKSVAINPYNAQAWNHLAIAQCQVGKFEEGVKAGEKALSLLPTGPDICFNLAKAHEAAGNFVEAENRYRDTVKLAPDYGTAWNNLGNLLQRTGSHHQAVEAYRKALRIDERNEQVRYNLATSLMAEGSDTESEEEFRRVITINPNHADALNNLGSLFEKQERKHEARELYDRAVRSDPQHRSAWFNFGNILDQANDLGQSLSALTKAAELLPNSARNLGRLLQAKRKVCDWQGEEELFSRLRELVANQQGKGEENQLSPFIALSLPFTEAEQLKIARGHSAIVADKAKRLRGNTEFSYTAGPGQKIRIGYLSADFREHPVAHLIAGLFALHDREGFQVNCYSIGFDDGGEYRERIRNTCDNFYDIQSMNALQAAQKINDDGIDILVDLTAYTAHGRPEILALRPAPIQINWLGYPGTMGAEFIDYILADRTVVPEENQKFYDEKVLYLPHSYQINDHLQKVNDLSVSRSDFGLPEEGIVFCCFNSNYKIDEAAFSSWMRILHASPGSVLWLFKGSEIAATNLRKNAEEKGIDPERLIFAERIPNDLHLARHQLADLFLDTFSYGAHTTARDALWVGLPVLTLEGDTFARKVCSGLVKVSGIPELVSYSQAEYERKAIAMVEDVSRCQKLSEQLIEGRKSNPLFDTPFFVKELEKIYSEIYQNH